MGLRDVYLLSYNVAQALAWSYLLLRTLLSLFDVQQVLPEGQVVNLLSTLAAPLSAWEVFVLFVAQNVGAVLEILHSLLGLVRSPVATVALQMLSRVVVVQGLAALDLEATGDIALHFPGMSTPVLSVRRAVSIVFLAWGCSEVVRYWFYALASAGKSVYALTWLRYSTFYVLYPLGLFGELCVLYASIPLVLQGSDRIANGLALAGFLRPVLSNPASVTRAIAHALAGLEGASGIKFQPEILFLIAAGLYVPGMIFMFQFLARQRRKQL